MSPKLRSCPSCFLFFSLSLFSLGSLTSRSTRFIIFHHPSGVSPGSGPTSFFHFPSQKICTGGKLSKAIWVIRGRMKTKSRHAGSREETKRDDRTNGREYEVQLTGSFRRKDTTRMSFTHVLWTLHTLLMLRHISMLLPPTTNTTMYCEQAPTVASTPLHFQPLQDQSSIAVGVGSPTTDWHSSPRPSIGSPWAKPGLRRDDGPRWTALAIVKKSGF